MACYFKNLFPFPKSLVAVLLMPLISPNYALADRSITAKDGSTETMDGEYSSNSPAVVVDGTNSTINAGSDVTIYTSSGYQQPTVQITNGGTINFNGVTIETSLPSVTSTPIINSNNGYVNLVGGSITAKNEATTISLENNSKANINGTEFYFDNSSFGQEIIKVTQSELTLNNTLFDITNASSVTALKVSSGSVNGSGNKITTSSSYAISSSGDDSSIILDDTDIHMTNGYHAIFTDSKNGTIELDRLNLTGSLSGYALTVHTRAIDSVSTITNSVINLDKGSGFYITAGTMNWDNVNATFAMNSGGSILKNGTGNIKNSTIHSKATGINNLGSLTVDNSEIKVSGNFSGIINSGTAKVTNSDIVIEGIGKSVWEATSGGTSELDNVTLTHNGSNGKLISSASGTNIINGKHITAVANGDFTHGIYAGFYSNGTISLEKSDLLVKGSNSSGIFAQQNGIGQRITLDNSAVVSEQGNGLHASGGIVDVELKNGAHLSGGGGMLILAEKASSTDSIVNLSADNHSTLVGDIQAETDSQIYLSLDNGSSWQGASIQADSITVGADSRWTMTDNSFVDNMQLNNQGQVIFAGTNTPYQTLTTNTIDGDGHFIMRTGIVEGSGDRLSITGSTAGEHSLTVINNGSATTNGSELLTVVDTADGLGHFDLSNDVELGGYIYGLRQTGNDWELYSTGRSGTADASANTLNVGYLLGYAETQTLLQRLGQLRTNEVDGNVWVRAYGGGFDSFGSQSLNGFTMNYYGTQFGLDKQKNTDSGMVYFGGMLGLTNSSQNFNHGNGNVNNRHIGLYAGYLDEQGFYFDTLLKYNQMRTRIDISDTVGDGVNGRATSHGYSLSLEAGQRFHLSEHNSGIYIEPQTQLTLSRQNSSHFNNSNGLRVDLSGYTSVLGRFGGIIGYDIKDSPTPINFYFKSAYIREFKGDTSYHLNGSKEEHSFKGDWWLNGVGASVEVGKQHNIYLDMEKASGKQFNQHQLNVGYRYSF